MKCKHFTCHQCVSDTEYIVYWLQNVVLRDSNSSSDRILIESIIKDLRNDRHKKEVYSLKNASKIES